LNGEIRLAYDDCVMAEYSEVLARPKFGFAPEDVADPLAFLQADRDPVTARPLRGELPDPDHLPFLEVAAEAETIRVTGDAQHYPAMEVGVNPSRRR
jgi:hypothetical protein